MHVASKELCEELYKLSEWTETDSVYVYSQLFTDSDMHPMPREEVERHWHRHSFFNASQESIPAYDLGYLLRKLPHTIHDEDFTYWIHLGPIENGHWGVSYECEDMDKYINFGDTPEDAACKLAIELFKQGVLTPELSSKEKENV